MEYPDSHSATTFSSNLLANFGRLGGQRFCTEELPTNQRLDWLKEVIGREYANVDVGTPDQMYLYNDMLIYFWSQGMRLSPIRVQCHYDRKAAKRTRAYFPGLLFRRIVDRGAVQA